MTKVLVVSDSHGNRDALREVLLREADAAVVVHCGDGGSDLRDLAPLGMQVKIARGNCDGHGAPLVLDFDVAGVRVMALHGHTASVHFSMDRLIELGIARSAAVVLFGHLHQQVDAEYGGTHFFNPGALSRQTTDPSYGVLIIGEGGELTLEHRLL